MRNATAKVLLAGYLVLFAWAAISPYDRATWWAENIPIVLIALSLVVLYARGVVSIILTASPSRPTGRAWLNVLHVSRRGTAPCSYWWPRTYSSGTLSFSTGPSKDRGRFG